jgi:hypothetical protein
VTEPEVVESDVQCARPDNGRTMTQTLPFCRQINWRGNVVPTHLWCPEHGFQRVAPEFDAFNCSDRTCMKGLHQRPSSRSKTVVREQNLTGAVLVLSSALAGDLGTARSVLASFDALTGGLR